MDTFRHLDATEYEKVLAFYKDSPSRKVLKIFFGIWKAMFFFSVFACIASVIEGLRKGDYFSLFSLLALGISFCWFWLLPNFILKSVDEKYNLVKNNKVFIKEATILDKRSHRARRSSSSGRRRYKTEYYVTIQGEGNDTYEVLTDKIVNEMSIGSQIFVLKFESEKPIAVDELAFSPMLFSDSAQYGFDNDF